MSNREIFQAERQPARPAPRPVADVITGGDVCRLVGIASSQLLHWCRAGVFGPEQAKPVGSGYRRKFTPAEVCVARACWRVSSAFGDAGFPGNAPWSLLIVVAAQVRSGVDVVRVRLAEHVELTVDVADLREAT